MTPAADTRRWVRLSDVVAHRSGNSKLIKGKQHMEPGPGRFQAFSASGPDIWADRAEHEGDGIVVSAVGARCGKTFIASGSWTAVANTHVLRPSSSVDVKYLWYLTNDEQFWIRSGTAQPFVKVKDTLAREVWLPPIDEQRRIVDILEDHLSRLDAADRELAASLIRLQALREQVVYRELFGGPLPSGADAAPRPPLAGVDDGDLPDLPTSWAWQRLADLADVVGGVTKDSKRQTDPSFVEVPYLRVANVQRGRLDLRTITTIRVSPKKAADLRLVPGDILLNEGGDRDKLGRGWVWDGQIDECIHQNHVFRARVREGVLRPRLLSWAANSFGGGWCERNGKQSVNLASISLSKIRLMPVPMPPIEEQPEIERRIEAALAGCDRLHEEVVRVRREGQALRRALLHAAFSGHLATIGGRSRVWEMTDV